MKKQTLEIEIPDGFMIDTFDQSSNKIKLKEKPKNPIERFLTDADVLADNGLTLEQFVKKCEGLEEHEVAFRFLNLLAKSLNQGWTPDFDDDDTWKYEPRFLGGSSGFRCHDYGLWASSSPVGSRLCFKTSELAVHAGTKFTKWYKSIIVIK